MCLDVMVLERNAFANFMTVSVTPVDVGRTMIFVNNTVSVIPRKSYWVTTFTTSL